MYSFSQLQVSFCIRCDVSPSTGGKKNFIQENSGWGVGGIFSAAVNNVKISDYKIILVVWFER